MQLTATYKQAQVIDVDLGVPPTQVLGHEQGKRRPCVVVNAFNALKLAIVVPCSSQKFSHYTVVQLKQGTSGLPRESYVLCHQVRTVSFERIKGVIGELNVFDMERIKTVLADTLEI